VNPLFPGGIPNWTNYELASGLVLGFHGCDASVGEALLRGEETHLRPSQNDYDWLGSGIYFWQNNPRRALQFALERQAGGFNSRGTVETPFVIGAVINPLRALDLAEASALLQVKDAYNSLVEATEDAGAALPFNGASLRARRLDCAVLNLLHDLRQNEGVPAYDSVRGLFWEGDELYPGAGLREANHIQICVRNPNCILGYFRPIENQS